MKQSVSSGETKCFSCRNKSETLFLKSRGRKKLTEIKKDYE